MTERKLGYMAILSMLTLVWLLGVGCGHFAPRLGCWVGVAAYFLILVVGLNAYDKDVPE